jgi:para-nitrobenzyl esterase
MFGHLSGCAAILASLSIPFVAAATPAAAQAEAPIVRTTDGELQGLPVKGIYAFLGVPYGADTGGTNRFLPPKPVAPWTGVRQAVAFGPQCAHQEPPMHGDITKLLFYSKLPMSEDCLSLNVWTPQPTAAKRRPVMVYLHGGGFFMGSSSDRYYDGANLSRGNDIVVVTLNHRLSVFGYSQLGPEAGPAYAESGAVGMLDIVQALQWVKANIAAFGGDPDNVTIFGQSGGGVKVGILMAMPSAKGLFQKAIMQSGPAVRAATPEQAQALTGQMLAKLNLAAKDVSALQALPPEALLTAANVGMMFTPVMGTAAIPRHPFEPDAPAQSAEVPLLIGSMHDEATSSMLSDPAWRTMDEALLLQRVTAIVGEQDAPKVIALYRAAAPGDAPMYLWADIATDSGFFGDVYTVAERKSAQAAPVYVYRVDWRSPVLDGLVRSMHAVDLPFVWDNLDISEDLVGSGPRQDRMAAMMSRSFVAFARTGDPNAGLTPHWPRYSAASRDVLIFNDTPVVERDPDGEKRAYWEAFKARKMAAAH